MIKKRISFRFKLILSMIVAIAVPILLIGYLTITQVEQALLEEKEKKLYAFARHLDRMLVGTFDQYLPTGKNLTNEEKIRILNQQLQPLTDNIAYDNPGLGIGYYSKELDAILTYGPSSELKDKIGLAISENHPGRDVLTTGQPMVMTGNQVRGDIMNAMIPIKRENEIIGYIWANELTSDVNQQIFAMMKKIFYILLIGLSIGMIIAWQISRKLGGAIDIIIASIGKMDHDLSYRLPSIDGVLNKIPHEVNKLIDKLVETKEQVRRTDRLRAVGELAAGMAHEIRNPLASIKAFTQIVEEQMERNDDNREYMEIIIKEIERINELTEQLLLFGKPTAYKEEKLCVDQLIRETLPLIEHELRKKESQLISDLEEIEMIADRALLQQVIINLLLNAVQSMDRQGMLAIHSTVMHDSIEFSVYNSGSTIAEEKKEKIFDPFYSNKKNGMGLGLTVTQNIVQLYDGRITCQNEKNGVTFLVRFPKQKRTH
ncbi:ATP-binding protein [Anaerobacillus sp. MEB173]|uniref:ATP-binding protein n=1 Tax=Anaerobacillus sp. MEB173 TaxID=3383345 RepID=UPI003F8DB6CE